MATVRSRCAEDDTGRRVVIVGGGYAGATCAVQLARGVRESDDLKILLVEPSPCQQALSELDLVAVGPPRPQFCELWHPTVFRNLPVTVCYNRAAMVRPSERVVVAGSGEEIPYWRLVIASGAIPSLPPIPGLRERAVTMWSVEDAMRLQQLIDAAFKQAATIADERARTRVLSFTVVGGGATGVEIVGTLGAMLPKRMRAAGLVPSDLRIHLVEARPEILYDLPPGRRTRAVRRLERMGCEVIAGDGVSTVGGDTITLASGRVVDSNVLVWCGGAKADPHAVEWGLQPAPDGRLVVDEYLRAEGCDDVYVIGDVASARHPQTKKTLPMLAQVAIQQGPWTAKNLLREARGEAMRPFEPHLRGEFVSVGPGWGVGVMYGLPLSGLPAIFMKRLTYVKYWWQVGGTSLAWKRTREMIAMQR